MKRLILASALVAMSFTAAHASSPQTKSANDSTIQSCHQTLSGKISQLQSSLNSNNTAAAQTIANDIMQLMHAGMMQGMNRIVLEPTGTAKAAANQKYLSMETAQYQYRQYLANIAANGTQLVAKANAFLSNY